MAQYRLSHYRPEKGIEIGPQLEESIIERICLRDAEATANSIAASNQWRVVAVQENTKKLEQQLLKEYRLACKIVRDNGFRYLPSMPELAILGR